MVTQIRFGDRDYEADVFTTNAIPFTSLSDTGNLIFSANPPLFLRNISITLTATSPSSIHANGDYIICNFAVTTTTGTPTIKAIPLIWAPGENSVTKTASMTKIINMPNVTNVAYSFTTDEGGTFTAINGVMNTEQEDQ